MKLVLKIMKSLTNALDYYNHTRDVEDLVSDINEIIAGLTVGDI